LLKIFSSNSKQTQNIKPIQHVSKATSSDVLEELPTGYLDVLPDSKGFNHIALFPTPDSTSPTWLTSGDWEVADGIQAVDVQRRQIWFLAARPSSERRLYHVALPSAASSQIITAPEEHTLNDTAYCSVSFSPEGRFYLYSSEGSDVPWQSLIDVDGKRRHLADAAALY
jgi:dipeptidyl aminopeptidase